MTKDQNTYIFKPSDKNTIDFDVLNFNKDLKKKYFRIKGHAL